MSDENPLLVQSKANIADTLRALATCIEDGTVTNYEISQSGNGSIMIKADISDGHASTGQIQMQTKMEGYTSTLTEHISKQKPDARQRIVKKMLEDGLTQAEIADKTMYCQQTISNDVKKLREKGEISPK